MNVQDVAMSLQDVQQEIQQACAEKNRNPDEITLIAVTKYVTIERTKEALQAGIADFGENRTDGFLDKKRHVQAGNWHFIGSLQSRKVKEIIEDVDFIHSLDRTSLAKEINKRAQHPVPCFVQVNVSEEEAKHGIHPEEVLAFIQNMEKYENIRIVGLMTMAPHMDDEDAIRRIFRELRGLQESVEAQNLPHAPCHYLSMGMSNDYRIAIEEGATHVRIGSKLVG